MLFYRYILVKNRYRPRIGGLKTFKCGVTYMLQPGTLTATQQRPKSKGARV